MVDDCPPVPPLQWLGELVVVVSEVQGGLLVKFPLGVLEEDMLLVEEIVLVGLAVVLFEFEVEEVVLVGLAAVLFEFEVEEVVLVGLAVVLFEFEVEEL